MGKPKVSRKDLEDLAGIYNTEGREEVYSMLRSIYDIQQPYHVLSRMMKLPELGYDTESDKFNVTGSGGREDEDGLFMSLDDLCAMGDAAAPAAARFMTDSRPAAMEKLIHELLGDRLLEMSRYIALDTISKTMIIDQTSLELDGYQLMMH